MAGAFSIQVVKPAGDRTVDHVDEIGEHVAGHRDLAIGEMESEPGGRGVDDVPWRLRRVAPEPGQRHDRTDPGGARKPLLERIPERGISFESSEPLDIRGDRVDAGAIDIN
jgi:hypothetical protein